MATLNSADALLTEHLRYTPLSLIDDIINTINAIVYRALSAIETGLLSTPPASLGFDQPSIPIDPDKSVVDTDDPDERQRAEVEEGVHRLETLLEATIDRTFDKFEIYTLRNILKVPEGLEEFVCLKHYEHLTLPLPSTAATPASITNLRQRLQSMQQLNLTLSHVHTSNELLLGQLKSILATPSGQLGFLASSNSKSTLRPSAQFTAAQLPALRSLLSDLRPRLQTLEELAETGARPGAFPERREERAAYLEGVVDRVVTTQLGGTRENGAGAGDAGMGPRRTEEEVRALERIAADGAGRLRDAGNASDDPMEG